MGLLITTISRPQIISSIDGTFLSYVLTSELFHLVVFVLSCLGLVKSAIDIGKYHSDNEWKNFVETEKIQEISKRLGKPEELSFTDVEIKIRTKLLFFSVLSLVMVKNGISINTNKPIFGIWLQGDSLDDQFIFKSMFWVIVYLLIHFIWSSLDIFSVWWLRLSGLFNKEKNSYDIGGWWYNQIESLEAHKNLALTARDKIDELKPHEIPKDQQVGKLREFLGPAISNIELVQEHLAENPQIIVSLKRFGTLPTFLLISQNLRWLLIELLAPILIGVYAVFSLFIRIWLT